MKIIITTAIAIVILMIGVQSASASIGSGSIVSTDRGQLSQLPHSHHPQAAYRSGFEHGVTDGKAPINVTSYIHQPSHGFAWHSSEFVTGISMGSVVYQLTKMLEVMVD